MRRRREPFSRGLVYNPGMAKESPLTRRETEILGLIAQGMSNDEIAQQLHISTNTVKVHVRNIFEKMGVQSRTEASIEGVKRGWVEVPGLSTEKEKPQPPVWEPLKTGLSPWWWAVLAAIFVVALTMAFWPTQTFYASTDAPPFTTDIALPVSAPSPRVDTPRWSLLSPMPTARSRAASALLSDGWHIVGGENRSGDLDVHEVYNPAWDQWITTTPRPVAARGAGAAGIDGMLYVAGGCHRASALNRMDVFDTETGAWQVAAPLPEPLCGLALVAWGSKLYAFGGWNGAQVQDGVYAFDSETGSWSQAAILPAPRAFMGSVVVGDAIYLFGGDDGEEQRAEVWTYYPDKDAWDETSSLPRPGSGLSVAADAGSIYIISGGEGEDDYPRERFDLTTQSWSTLDAPRRGPWHHASAAMIGPNLHIVGGWGGDYLAIHEVYQASHLLFLPAQGVQ